VSNVEADGWDYFFALLHYADLNSLSDQDAIQRRQQGHITDADLAPYIAERQSSRAEWRRLMDQATAALRESLTAGEALRASLGAGDPPEIWEPLAEAHAEWSRRHGEICAAVQKLQGVSR
jgi:hypothetical protein